jgi:hypothetical protein
MFFALQDRAANGWPETKKEACEYAGAFREAVPSGACPAVDANRPFPERGGTHHSIARMGKPRLSMRKQPGKARAFGNAQRIPNP